MIKGIENVATKDDILNETTGLIQYLRKCYADIIKWMFFFQITQAIITAWLLYHFFK